MLTCNIRSTPWPLFTVKPTPGVWGMSKTELTIVFWFGLDKYDVSVQQ